MSEEKTRVKIAVGRKVLFAGVAILLAWLALFGLRGAISPSLISEMNQQMSMDSRHLPALSLNPWTWDWSKSLWSGQPVAGIVGDRLGGTLALIGATMLLSLLIALLFLYVGRLISRATDRPPWLGKTRSVLRFVLISGAVSIPVFAWATLVIVYPQAWWNLPANSPIVFWLSALTVSFLPIWLLVQYGHGEMASTTDGVSWRHLAAQLAIRDLRLAGAVFVLTMLVGLTAPFANLGRLFIDAINRRDFPIIFGIAFASVVIIVLFKLAADLSDIAYRRFTRSPATVTTTPVPARTVPRWVPAVCFALVAVALVVAVAAPLIAPYGYNSQELAFRLAPPSGQFPLGTDNLGRDILSRVIFGIREDVFMALMAVGIMAVLAVGWAVLAARVKRSDDWRGDTLEDLVMLPRDVLYAFPWLIVVLLAVVFTRVSGPVSAFGMPLILGVGLALLPRAVGVMQEAYRSQPEGEPWSRAVLRALPVMLFFAVGGGILYVASAGYLGLGVPPPAPELGMMLAGPARRYVLQAPWMALWPPVVLVMLLTVWVMAGESLLERFGFRSKALWSKVWE